MQRSEGDGVAGMLGGGQGEAIFGTKTINVLARFTAILAVVMLVLIVVLGKMGSSDKSLMDDVPVSSTMPKATSKKIATKTAKPATNVKTPETTSGNKQKLATEPGLQK